MKINGFRDIVEKNMEEAFEYSKKGCELGHMASCHNASLMLARGQGCEQDLEKSRIYRNAYDEMKRTRSGGQRTHNFQRGVGGDS